MSLKKKTENLISDFRKLDSDVNMRRATGFVFNPPPIEEDDDSETRFNNNNNEEENKQETEKPENVETKVDIEDVIDRPQNKERKKSVSFFGVVEKINIELSENEQANEDANSDNSEDVTQL